MMMKYMLSIKMCFQTIGGLALKLMGIHGYSIVPSSWKSHVA